MNPFFQNGKNGGFFYFFAREIRYHKLTEEKGNRKMNLSRVDLLFE